MPNIREAGPVDIGLRPSETGVEAQAATGRRVGGFYNQAAGAMSSIGERIGGAVRDAGNAAVQYLEHREISHGAAAFAGLTEGLTQQWNDISSKADPNDPTVAGQFHEQVLEPALDKFRSDGFLTEGGQRWADAHVDALRQHLYQKADADMAEMAGIAAHENARAVVNKLSNTVMNDPSSLDFSLKALETSTEGVVGSSPNLKGTAGARVRAELLQTGRESIIKSAAFGYISRTGEMPPWATDPKYQPYINGPELKSLQQAQKTQQRTNFLQQKQIELYQRQQDEQAVHTAANKNFADNVTFDPSTGRANINPQFFQQTLDIAKKFPNAPNAANVARTYLDWGESQQRARAEPIISDATVKGDLMTRMVDPDKPTSKIDILKAESDGKLSPRDGTIMRELVTEMEAAPLREPNFKDTIDAAKERVGFGTQYDGHERFANAMQAFMPEYLKQKRAGTLQPNALDLQDEDSLIRQTIKRFEPSPTERMQGFMLKKMGAGDIGGFGAPPPPLPKGYPPDAKVGADGNWYVTRNGQSFRVDPKAP